MLGLKPVGQQGDLALSELQSFSANARGRDFFIGDLHGCYSQLMDKLQAVNFDREVDRVFSVGDLVDRGPESRACLELPLEPWFHAVWGNHEEMMREGLWGGDDAFWIINGGRWILQEDRRRIRDIAENVFRQMPLAIEVEYGERRIGVIHADVTSGQWGCFSRQHDLWSRSRILGETTGPVSGIDLLVVGHSVLDRVTAVNNVLYLDTGGVFDGELQLLEASELFALMESAARA